MSKVKGMIKELTLGEVTIGYGDGISVDEKSWIDGWSDI